jgi:hypothetical protein
LKPNENTLEILNYKLAICGRLVPRILFAEMPNLEEHDIIEAYKELWVTYDVSEAEVQEFKRRFHYEDGSTFQERNPQWPEKTLKMIDNLVRQVKTSLAMKANIPGVRAKT